MFVTGIICPVSGGGGLGHRDSLTHLRPVRWPQVQSKAIPLALEGKDLLVRARTGSGKTAAFGLPLLHKILTRKADNPPAKLGVLAVVRG
jgi:ATP-dependent RNA helicase DDX56/DBP9